MWCTILTVQKWRFFFCLCPKYSSIWCIYSIDRQGEVNRYSARIYLQRLFLFLWICFIICNMHTIFYIHVFRGTVCVVSFLMFVYIYIYMYMSSGENTSASTPWAAKNWFAFENDGCSDTAPFGASDQEVMMAVVHRDGLLLRLAHEALKVQRVIVDFYSGQLRLYTVHLVFFFVDLDFWTTFLQLWSAGGWGACFRGCSTEPGGLALCCRRTEVRWWDSPAKHTLKLWVDSEMGGNLHLWLYPLHSFTFFTEERTHRTHWCVLTNMTTILHQTGGRTSISLVVWCGIMAKLYSLHPKIFAAILIWSCNSANRQSCLFRERIFFVTKACSRGQPFETVKQRS